MSNSTIIAAARAVLRPSEVKPGCPNWFRLAFMRAYPDRLRNPSKSEVVYKLREMGETWLDHEGHCDWYGRDAFVSEPYGIDAKELASIEQLAISLGCEAHVSANSWHFPGSTLRIIFVQPEAQEVRP